MPKTQASNSTGSSGLGITRRLKKNRLRAVCDLSINRDLKYLIMSDKKNDIRDIKFLCEEYIFKGAFPPIDFKEFCNSAIMYNQPFYLLLILSDFGRWSLRKNKSNSKPTPLIEATYSKKIYPFAMLLCLKELNELHIDCIIEHENVFDRINTLNESFYVFLLVMKKKDLINRINDEKHKNISPLKIKINHIVNKSLLPKLYSSINSKFFSFNQDLDNLRLTENGIYVKKYSEVMKLKSLIETAINKIEEELQNLKKIFMQICNSGQDIKKTDIFCYFFNDHLFQHNSRNDCQINQIHPFPNPASYVPQGENQANANPTQQLFYNSLLSHAPQSNSQTGHPTCQNLTNALASHHLQSSHQASRSTTDQQYSSLSLDHSPAFRSEQSVSQNINSISDLVNISLSLSR